jgi:hypothetical protein
MRREGNRSYQCQLYAAQEDSVKDRGAPVEEGGTNAPPDPYRPPDRERAMNLTRPRGRDVARV